MKVVAEAGYNVSIVDQSDKILNNAVDGIKTSLKRIAKKKYEKDPAVSEIILSFMFIFHAVIKLKFKAGEKFITNVIGRIKPTVSLQDGANSTDLVIEAIVENMDAKHKLFSQLDKIAPRYI